MLILAGVSINAIIGENGLLTKSQYATFLSEMAAVEEAVEMWKAGEAIEAGGQTTAIPTNGMCKSSDVTSTERLTGEVGYYRVWSMSRTRPTTNILSSASEFNSAYNGELVTYPAGVQDLYYLNNEACGIDSKKTYVIDAATGMVYSMAGINLKGVACYSSNMAKAVMNGDTTTPNFAEAEVSGSGSGEKLAGNVQSEYLYDENGNLLYEADGTTPKKNPNYNPNGFQIMAHPSNQNIYKLYNNGELYGKGVKGNLLNTEQSKMQDINPYIWNEMTIPSNISNPQEIVPGYNVIFVIDGNKDLWAWGSNSSNCLGLTQEQQNEYTGREAMKLNVNSKKVYKVIPNENSVWVITEDNELYACGINNYGGLGINEVSAQSEIFKKVEFVNPKSIKKIQMGANSSNFGTVILTENGKTFFAGDSSRYMKNLFNGTELETTVIMQFTEIFNDVYGTIFENKIVDIAAYGDWSSQIILFLDEMGNLYKVPINSGSITKTDTNITKMSGRRDAVMLIEKKTDEENVEYKVNSLRSSCCK